MAFKEELLSFFRQIFCKEKMAEISNFQVEFIGEMEQLFFDNLRYHYCFSTDFAT